MICCWHSARELWLMRLTRWTDRNVASPVLNCAALRENRQIETAYFILTANRIVLGIIIDISRFLTRFVVVTRRGRVTLLQSDWITRESRHIKNLILPIFALSITSFIVSRNGLPVIRIKSNDISIKHRKYSYCHLKYK